MVLAYESVRGRIVRLTLNKRQIAPANGVHRSTVRNARTEDPFWRETRWSLTLA